MNFMIRSFCHDIPVELVGVLCVTKIKFYNHGKN